MFFLFQGLSKVLRAKMADPRGPLLPGLLWWWWGLWTAETEDNYTYLSMLNKKNTYNTTSQTNHHKSVILNCIAHLCMNSMILSLLRSCGNVYFSSPFTKYFRLGKPEILKRSPTPLCTVASTAANTPGLWRNNKERTLNHFILSN